MLSVFLIYNDLKGWFHILYIKKTKNWIPQFIDRIIFFIIGQSSCSVNDYSVTKFIVGVIKIIFFIVIHLFVYRLSHDGHSFIDWELAYL